MLSNRKYIHLLLFCAIATSAFGCKRQVKQLKPTPPKPVVIMKVKAGNHADLMSCSGNIKPSQIVKIAFKIPGTITYLDSNEGDYVRKGQLLAQLDGNQYALNALAAQSGYVSAKLQVDSQIPSTINQAKSQLDLITSRYQRYQNLFESGALPRDKFEAIETELTVIKNKYQEALEAQAVSAKKLDQAKALSDLARTNLHDAKIYAPIDGVVVKKLAEPGELTATGYPVLVLGALARVEVEIGVTDQYVNRLKLGQSAEVYIFGLERKVTGTITEIGAMADEKTRLFPVKLAIANPNRQLKPGMIAKVTIPLDSTYLILVPINTVIKQPSGPVVFVYSPQSKTVIERKVSVGRLFTDQIEITAGLKPGEQIVVGGHFKLKNRDRVKAEVAQ